MKKIVNGALYDTTTAKELGADSYGSGRDFDHWAEALYRTKSGKYFIHGQGGPRSRYAETIGQNQWSGGEKLLPMTREAAMAWAEEHLSVDAYEAAFGLPAEGETESIYLTMDAATVARARALCEDREITLGAGIECAIRAWVASEGM